MTDVVGMIGLYDEFKDLPFRFDTDVNAPAVAEFNLTQTSTSTSTSAAYVTVRVIISTGRVTPVTISSARMYVCVFVCLYVSTYVCMYLCIDVFNLRIHVCILFSEHL